MNRPLFLLLTLLFLLTGIAGAKPNLLIVLADDMGYGDLGLTGSKSLKTPHLDSLAASGVFCSQAYVASSVCSPSRAGLITGTRSTTIWL
jgi:arylsulfatase B